MSERLTAAELARMRADHYPHVCGIRRIGGLCAFADDLHDAAGFCQHCFESWPCSATRLLDHFMPGPVPHLAGVQR